jgi:hypothetical protein
VAYTFLALQTKLTTQIGDPNLDSTVMADALNYTEQSIFEAFDLTLNSDSQTNAVAAGANTLTSALPTDLERITSLYISSPAAMANDLTDYFLPVAKFRSIYPNAGTYTGPIQEWTFLTSVEFAMLSSVAVVVKLDYVKSIPLMSGDTDVPTIPQSYEELLMLGAKMRVYEQKEDFDYANQFTNRYADLLESFTLRYSTGQVDYQVVVPGARGRS